MGTVLLQTSHGEELASFIQNFLGPKSASPPLCLQCNLSHPKRHVPDETIGVKATVNDKARRGAYVLPFFQSVFAGSSKTDRVMVNFLSSCGIKGVRAEPTKGALYLFSKPGLLSEFWPWVPE